MTTTSPRVSVIMPCFNEAQRLPASVGSVANQTFKDFELIVVDDGSQDNSLDVLTDLAAQYPFLRVFAQENRGAGAARNKGLKEARGEYIAFLDADDTWHPDCLLKLYSKLSSTPDAVLVYCGWQNIGVDAGRAKPFVPPDYENEQKIETLLRGCRWPIHAALTRKDAIDKAGGFDEQWSSCMDYDLWLRVASKGKIVRVPEVLAYYHHHEGEQITKNRARIAINHYLIQKKYVKENPGIERRLGEDKIKEIIEGEHLHQAYVCYWDRDLKASHILFRRVFAGGSYKKQDLRYLLPALLPYPVYRALIRFIDRVGFLRERRS